VDQGDVSGNSPAPLPEPMPELDWRAWRVFVGPIACVCALLVAYDWAQPCDAGSLGPHLDRLVLHIVPVWGALVIFLAWRGHFRPGLLLLLALMLPTLVGMTPEVGAAVAGWPGGWAFGAAGLVAGAACSWLCMRLVWLGRPLIVGRDLAHGSKRLSVLASGSFTAVSCSVWGVVFVIAAVLVPATIARVFFSIAAALFFLILLRLLLKRPHLQ